jgi:hypothetical protein
MRGGYRNGSHFLFTEQSLIQSSVVDLVPISKMNFNYSSTLKANYP